MSENTDGTNLHLLPADAYPGLLGGWCGPAMRGDLHVSVFSADGETTLLSRNVRAGSDVVWQPSEWRMVPSGVRLDLHRPECIDRVIRVLAAGVRCDECSGSGNDHTGHPGEGLRCPACGGTGCGIAPADMSWTRDLPAWQAGAILAASVLRVVAGEAPVRSMVVRVSPKWAVESDRAYYDDYNGDDHLLIPLTGGKVARVEAP